MSGGGIDRIKEIAYYLLAFFSLELNILHKRREVFDLISMKS